MKGTHLRRRRFSLLDRCLMAVAACLFVLGTWHIATHAHPGRISMITPKTTTTTMINSTAIAPETTTTVPPTTVAIKQLSRASTTVRRISTPTTARPTAHVATPTTTEAPKLHSRRRYLSSARPGRTRTVVIGVPVS